MRNYLALFHVVILPVIIYFIYKETIFYSFLSIALLFLSVFISFIEWLVLKKIRHHESFLRPFKDKFIILGLLLIFVIKKDFPSAIFTIFVLRDIIVGSIRIRATRDNIVIKGKLYGKLITFFQFFIVFGLLIKNFLINSQLTEWVALLNFNIIIFTIIALIIAIISIGHYSSSYTSKLRKRRKEGKLVRNEKMIILANRRSGSYNNPYRRHLLKLFIKRRKAKLYYLPNQKEMYSGISKVIKKFKHVIIAGGDGSFESALNCTAFKNKSLGFFPLGAGNSYYSYFYKGNRFEYLRSRFSFREIPLDTLEITLDKNRRETTFMSIGIDAEVVKEMKNIRIHSFKDYFMAATKVIFGPRKSYEITIIVDGNRHYWQNCFNLIISKIPFIGYGLRSVLGKVRPDDEYALGLGNVNTHSAFFNKGLRLWAMVLTQLGLNKAPLVPLRGKEFLISSKMEFPVQAGGDFLAYTKNLKVKVARKQQVLII